jgi:hypothetical protein
MIRFAPVLLLAALTACSGSAIWTAKDSWYAPAPTEADEWAAVPSTSFGRVDEGRVGSAVSMLDESSAIPISDSVASSLTGGRIRGDDAWLVRALCLACGIGQDDVHRDGTTIFVSHVALGRRPLPMRRWPIVVVGIDEIRSVFVEVTSYQ